MKKLLGIVVLGLFLVSCSDAENDKLKKIEVCADIEYEKQWEVKIGSDLTINEKINADEDYEEWFIKCENALKKNPSTYKAKYLD